jgi:hypothetical protein
MLTPPPPNAPPHSPAAGSEPGAYNGGRRASSMEIHNPSCAGLGTITEDGERAVATDPNGDPLYETPLGDPTYGDAMGGVAPWQRSRASSVVHSRTSSRSQSHHGPILDPTPNPPPTAIHSAPPRSTRSFSFNEQARPQVLPKRAASVHAQRPLPATPPRPSLSPIPDHRENSRHEVARRPSNSHFDSSPVLGDDAPCQAPFGEDDGSISEEERILRQFEW